MQPMRTTLAWHARGPRPLLALGLVGVLVPAVAGGCGPKVPLYPSRADYDAIRDKLRRAGRRAQEAVRLVLPAMVDALELDRPYKYVVTAGGKLVVAPQPADTPGDPFHHPALARGGPVRTAGFLRLTARPSSVPTLPSGAPAAPDGPPGRRRVVIDQRSSGYCPTFESLRHARAALVAIGLSPGEIVLEDRPPRCLPAK